MDLYEANSFLRVIFTIITILLTVGPTVADFNKTHATHPKWIGHARFHVVWQVLGFYPVAFINLIILWYHIPDFYYPYQIYLWLIWYFGFVFSFFLTMFFMPLFKGTLSDPGGRVPFKYTFGDKLKLLPFSKDKHLPFKINNELKIVYVDENLHNLILPTVIVILTLIFVLQV